MMQLPINLVQYLHSDYSRPSHRRGIGRVLRDKLKELKSSDSIITFNPIDSTYFSLETILENHRKELKQFGVMMMRFDEDLIILVEEEKFDREKFENFLNSTSLAEKNKKYSYCTPLNSFGSPID